jgi:hypothetical protein
MSRVSIVLPTYNRAEPRRWFLTGADSDLDRPRPE